MASTGKLVEIFFENVLDTYEEQDQMLDLCDFVEYDPATMQNTNNYVWRPVEQHAPLQQGWDLTGGETGIVEPVFPLTLEDPWNDLVKEKAHQLRDKGFWERRGKKSGQQQATALNQRIAYKIKTQGSLFFRSNTTSGYDFISEMEAQMDERQLTNMQRNCLLNTRTRKKFSEDLAARQTVQGRPEVAWSKSQLGQNIAGFDPYYGSFIGTLAGGATPVSVVVGNQSFAPEGGGVSADGAVVTNVDHRIAVIPVDVTAGFNVGDKIHFEIGGTPIYAVGNADKSVSTSQFETTIVAISAGVSLSVFPKPIAVGDAALSDEEEACANINTQILDGAAVIRDNIDTLAQANLFWEKNAVQVVGGEIPAELFKQYAGFQVLNETLKNGLELYMIYDGDMITMDFRYRCFTWSGVTIAAPENCGVGIAY